ncbi:MAG: bifunctional riboflavin kinase/FAD synthetase, partial [Candidatus Latescibacterota bacterium]
PRSVVYHHSGFSLPPDSFRKTYLNHRNNLVMHCKNQPLTTLLWLLPLRLPLEILASLGYLAQRRWSSALAPWASLLWLISHPLNILRRRRRVHAHRRHTAHDGIYAGSLLFQYYARGTHRASDLIAEEGL